MAERVIRSVVEQSIAPVKQVGMGVDRHRVIAATAVVWIFMHLCVMLVRGLTVGVHVIHPASPVSIAVMMGVFWAGHSRLPATPIAAIMLLNMLVTTYLFSWVSSGFKGPVIYLLAVLPVITFMTIGRVAGWFMCLVVALWAAIFAYLNFVDFPFPPRPVAGNGIFIARAVALIIVILLVSWIAWYYTLVHDKFHETLAKRNQELERTAQYKSDFLAHMSHEFRTPLNSIIGFSTMLIKRNSADLDKRSSTSLNSIHRNGVHMLSLVEDILDVISMEQGKLTITREPVQLVKLVRDCCNDAQVLAENKSLVLNLEFPIRLEPEVFNLDPKRIRQVVTNLISNAIKYTAAGTVSVVLSRGHEDFDDAVVISVKDTGCGMDEDELQRLFHKFARLKDHEKSRILGTGLGLVIVNELVVLHDGEIIVQSEKGRGSNFAIVLPVAPLELFDVEAD